jgi:hypothetical protein
MQEPKATDGLRYPRPGVDQGERNFLVHFCFQTVRGRNCIVRVIGGAKWRETASLISEWLAEEMWLNIPRREGRILFAGCDEIRQK